MKRNALYAMGLMAAAAALLANPSTLRAAELDDKIEESFKKTFVYETHLKDDAIKMSAKDGVATLTGTVARKPTRRWLRIPSPVCPESYASIIN